ncbi:hypothetical protein Tco_1310217 [Tanacetum coccineum]
MSLHPGGRYPQQLHKHSPHNTINYIETLLFLLPARKASRGGEAGWEAWPRVRDGAAARSGASQRRSLPKDHMADFHHLDDARDIWLAVKARFRGNDESKKMWKSMLKQEFSEFRVSEFLLLALLFWSTASLRAPELGPPAILATIDRTPYTITEDTVQSQLQLGDDEGIADLPISDIYLGMDNLGYPTEGKLTFHKNNSLAIALICLSDGRRFNWSRYIFKGMLQCFPLYVLEIPHTIPETIQETRPEPDNSQEHLPTPPRPTTSDHIPPVFEQGHTSDPNIASFSGAHESDPDLFTSTNVEDETLGGSFHTTPPRTTLVPPEGPTSGGAEDLATLTALSSLVSELVQKVSSLESELKAHKLLFKDVVGRLVKKVKALELKLKTRSRKVVMSESDKEEEEEQDVDPLIKLANAAAASDAHVDVSPGADIPPSPPLPTDLSAGVSSGVSTGAPTGPSTVSPSSTTVPTRSSVPAAETIPAGSGTTPESPSSPVRDARKGKGVAVDEPTPTHDKTFKQLEEERLGWEAAQRLQAQELADFEKQRAESLMKDANLARQMAQDSEMTDDQRKSQQEVLTSATNYSDADWDIILARLQANPDFLASSTIFGVDFTDDDFAAKMVTLVNSRRKELAEQRAQERRDKPMTPAQLRQYMRTYVKNQGPAIYSIGWTMAQVRKLSLEQLQEEFDKIQRVVAFTRGLKRDDSPITTAFSKKLKTSDVEVDVKAPSHGVPQEVEVEAPSQDVSCEKVDAPSHSQNIPEAQVEVPSQEASVEDVELLGRKGVHTSQSTIPIEEGDPDAEHKLCIKYASDEDSASDCDTPIHLYVVVDWELLPTGLGSINAIYRLDNSRKYFTSLREILHLVTRADLMMIYGRVMTFYQDKKAEGVGLVLWGDLKILMDSPEVNDGSDFWKNQHTWSIQNWKLYSFSGVHVLETVSGLVIHMFVDKKYPLTTNLIERMLDHQLEICHGTVGNELTTAVQLIAFLKKQISDSKRPKVHEWYC